MSTGLEWGLCEYVIVHTILGGSLVILWISLGGKPKWLTLKIGYHDVMRKSPIQIIMIYGRQDCKGSRHASNCFEVFHLKWGLCEYVIVHTILPLQSSHSEDLAGWQAEMASIEIWIP